MYKLFIVSSAALILLSCRLQSDQSADYSKNKLFHLGLNPGLNSRYYYKIENETEILLDVNGQKISIINNKLAGVYYDVAKDTSGSFLIRISYDKLHIHSKKGDTESDMDAANAASSINPVEKALGVLTGTILSVKVTPAGEIKEIDGYKEMSEKLLDGFAVSDSNSKAMVRDQLEKLVKDGLLKQNISQLFKIFPDSVVHVGDKWKIASNDPDLLNLGTKSFYSLKSVNDDVAVIESKSEITSDSTLSGLFGSSLLTRLNGTQRGEYEMELKSGMLTGGLTTGILEGVVQIAGKEIPVKINTRVRLTGRRIKEAK